MSLKFSKGKILPFRFVSGYSEKMVKDWTVEERGGLKWMRDEILVNYRGIDLKK